MALTLAQVATHCRALPEVEEIERNDGLAWQVDGKPFAWERPFRKADIKRFGDARIPAYPVIAVRVADLGEKEAVLAAGYPGFFTIPHFDGYAAVLIELKLARAAEVKAALNDAAQELVRARRSGRP